MFEHVFEFGWVVGFGGDFDGAGAFGADDLARCSTRGGEEHEWNVAQGGMGFDPGEEIDSGVVIDLVAGEDGGGETEFGAVVVNAGALQIGLGFGNVPRNGNCSAVGHFGERLGEESGFFGVVLNEQEVMREVANHGLILRVPAVLNYMEFSRNETSSTTEPA